MNTLDLDKFLLPESNEVDDVNKANSNETVYASDPLPVTDLVLIHSVPQKLNTLLTLSVFPNTASNDIQQHVNSAISADVDNDSQSDCHSDLHSCARVFRSIMIWEWCNFANMFSQSLQLMTCWFYVLLQQLKWVILRLMNFNAIILCHWNSWVKFSLVLFFKNFNKFI